MRIVDRRLLVPMLTLAALVLRSLCSSPLFAECAPRPIDGGSQRVKPIDGGTEGKKPIDGGTEGKKPPPKHRRPEKRRRETSVTVAPIAVRPHNERRSDDAPNVTTTVLKLKASDRRQRTLGEVLRHITGVDVKQLGGPLGRETIALRGTDSQQTLVLLDGVRLNTLRGGGFDLSQLPLSAIERVEILRGGLSPIFGSDALGGVINIHTRRHALSRQTDLSFGIGSFASYSASITQSLPLPHKLSLISSLTVDRSDGRFRFIDENGTARWRENNQSRREQLFLSLCGRLQRKWRLAAIATLSHVDRGMPGVSQFPSLAGHDSLWLAVLLLRADGRSLFRRWSVRNDVSIRYAGRRFRDPVPWFGPPIESASRLALLSGQHRSTIRLSDRHLLVARLELREELGRIEGGASQPRSPRRVTIAVALGSEHHWLSESLTLTSALRVEYNQRFSATIAPSVGFRYRPSRYASIWLNGSRSYRIPSFDELFFDAGSVRGNPSLAPEDAWGLELGISAGIRAISARASGFVQWARNLILFLPKTAYLVEADNSGRARIAGCELELRARWRDHLELSVGYTFTDARQTEIGGHWLPLRSKHRLSLRLRGGYRWIRLALSLDLRSRFPFDRFESNFGKMRALLNLGVTLRPDEHLELFVDLRNLLDQRSTVDALQFPLPGVSLFGGLRVRL